MDLSPRSTIFVIVVGIVTAGSLYARGASDEVAAWRRQQAAEAARTLEAARSLETQRQARESERARLLAAEAERARSVREGIAREERAWREFHNPESRCVHPADWETQVDCGNAYIAARKEFEERWARGEW